MNTQYNKNFPRTSLSFKKLLVHNITNLNKYNKFISFFTFIVKRESFNAFFEIDL